MRALDQRAKAMETLAKNKKGILMKGTPTLLPLAWRRRAFEFAVVAQFAAWRANRSLFVDPLPGAPVIPRLRVAGR